MLDRLEFGRKRYTRERGIHFQRQLNGKVCDAFPAKVLNFIYDNLPVGSWPSLDKAPSF